MSSGAFYKSHFPSPFSAGYARHGNDVSHMTAHGNIRAGLHLVCRPIFFRGPTGDRHSPVMLPTPNKYGFYISSPWCAPLSDVVSYEILILLMKIVNKRERKWYKYVCDRIIVGIVNIPELFPPGLNTVSLLVNIQVV